MSLKIAMAQINPVLGDLAGNTAKILAAAQRAREQGADLLLTPELALCGDSPEDLLLRPDFYAACDAALETLVTAPEAAGILLLVGHPLMHEGRRFDAATLLGEGRRLRRLIRCPEFLERRRGRRQAHCSRPLPRRSLRLLR